MFVQFIIASCLNCVHAWDTYIQEGFSPLGAAIARGHTVVAEILIQCGANVNIKDKVVGLQHLMCSLIPSQNFLRTLPHAHVPGIK